MNPDDLNSDGEEITNLLDEEPIDYCLYCSSMNHTLSECSGDELEGRYWENQVLNAVDDCEDQQL